MKDTFEPAHRVCIVLLSGIGDVVHGLPIVNALKREDPNRHITWVVQSEPAPLLRPHPSVHEVVTFDRKRGLGEVRALWRKFRPRSFDLVLNINIYFKAVVPTFTARAPHKICFGRDRSRDLVWLFANHRLPPRPRRHKQDQYIEFLDYLEVPAEPIEWRFTFTEQERDAQREYFGRFEGRRTLAIVATSGRSAKDWPTDRIAELATACERDLGFKIILLGGSGSREQRRAREIIERSEASIEWGLGPDLRRLLYLIDRCDLVVAPDTGPLHIARALGRVVIGLYGHTDPLREGPYRAFEDLWIDRYNFDAPDQPCDLAGRGGRLDRMDLIPASEVLEKVELALDRYLRPARTARDQE